jgi:hypothetical protein
MSFERSDEICGIAGVLHGSQNGAFLAFGTGILPRLRRDPRRGIAARPVTTGSQPGLPAGLPDHLSELVAKHHRDLHETITTMAWDLGCTTEDPLGGIWATLIKTAATANIRSASQPPIWIRRLAAGRARGRSPRRSSSS